MSYVLCLHRWVGQQARYENYMQPTELRLRAVCTEESVASLPHSICDSWEALPSMDDIEAVLRTIEEVIRAHGVPELVVALNEADLLTAALVRERWGIQGDDCERTEQFRDKLKMLEIAKRQDVVANLPAARPEDAQALAEQYGFPLILKPRFGTASQGVKKVYSLDEIEREAPFEKPMMVQVFCTAPILHVDGWWDGNELVVATVSRYSNTCAEFSEDSPLGSIELSGGEEEQRIIDKVRELANVFSPNKELVFHLELFEEGDELTFLEIAARVGGAEIPFMWREIRNIDLLGIAWELQTEFSTHYRDEARRLSENSRPIHHDRGAWIIAKRNGANKEELETLYWAQPEDIERYASGVYEGAKTRLRFKSSEHELLKQDVKKVFSQLSEV